MAKVERGSRTLALDEAVALCITLRVGMISLLPSRGSIEIGPTSTIPAKTLLEAMGPTDDLGDPRRRNFRRVDGSEELVDLDALRESLSEIADDVERLLGAPPSATLLMDAAVAERGEAEQMAARRLDLTAFQVAALALSLWARSLTDEREHRLATEVHRQAPTKALRAMRGQITRALIAELEAARDGAAKKGGAR